MKNAFIYGKYILVVLIMVSSFRNLSAENKMVAYWSFDKGSGSTVFDSSGNGNNGRISGAKWTLGIKGKALLFSGTADTVIVNDASSLEPATVTVEAWIYADSFPLSPSGIIVSKEYGSMASYRLQMHSSGSIVQFVTNQNWGDECRGTTVLANHQWHHVAGI